MKIAIVSKTLNKEIGEILRMLGDRGEFFLNIADFDSRQIEFNGVYCPDPKDLLKIKVKIPYFYDISAKTFSDEMNYSSFTDFYSQISGPEAVFVSDKKLNKSANWWGLNTYWINRSVDTEITYKDRKYFTPKLHIGYIYKDRESFEILKNVILSKKSNWVFHVYLPDEIDSDIKNTDTFFYSGDLKRVEEELFSKVHIHLNYDLLLDNMSETFPSTCSAESMLRGSVLIDSNSHGNNTNIFFDKFNYFKLDFIDTNTILNTLRFLDKRREKLESCAKEGRRNIKKYFDFRDTAKLKLDIILRCS